LCQAIGALAANGEFTMRRNILAILALAALVLAGIIAISPNVTTIANEASTEIYGIDILGLTKNAKHLPEEQFAAH
jgi:hypothetical protein